MNMTTKKKKAKQNKKHMEKELARSEGELASRGKQGEVLPLGQPRPRGAAGQGHLKSPDVHLQFPHNSLR